MYERFSESICNVSTHSHPKVAALRFAPLFGILMVSTHSHPKVAASVFSGYLSNILGFNTQPPEGGCFYYDFFLRIVKKFQHTATRRWLPVPILNPSLITFVSTHSHPKVAAWRSFSITFYYIVSTHSHPKVAAKLKKRKKIGSRVSTHSHPKVAANLKPLWKNVLNGFNTQPPEGGCVQRLKNPLLNSLWFQHTAPRRWLHPC